MPVSLNDIVVLRKKLESDRQQLELNAKKIVERERAMGVIEEMLREAGGDQETTAEQLPLPGTSTRATGFAQAILDGIAHFDGNVFTAGDLLNLLKSQGAPLPRTQTGARVSTALKKLQDSGVIDRLAKGKGTKFARYRARQKATG